MSRRWPPAITVGGGVACLLLAACSPAAGTGGGCDPRAPVNLQHIAIPPIAGRTASFGAMEIDQAAHLLYAADRTGSSVDVVDVSGASGRFRAQVTMPAAPTGLALARDLGRLFVGLEDGSVAVVDLVAGRPEADRIVSRVRTGGKVVELLDYDPRERKVYAASGSDGQVTAVDAVKMTALKRITVATGLQQPRYNPQDGKVYVPSADSDTIYRIDPVRDEVIQQAAVGTRCRPAGLAINSASGEALLGCQSESTQAIVVWNLATGRLVAYLADAGGADLVIYSQAANRFFVAAPHNSGGAEIAVFSGSPVKYFTSVKTKAGGGSVAYDESNRIVYTPDQRPGKGELLSFGVPAC